LLAVARSFLSSLVHTRAGRRDSLGDDPGGAGVPARLDPRTPVLAGSAARPYPPQDERRGSD
ncbi:MAG TPA: hypothetical protein VK689_14330, partial [Armatimonadota bacterium]|nr:hypothetical protein [Armatimonadota bacterium]